MFNLSLQKYTHFPNWQNYFVPLAEKTLQHSGCQWYLCAINLLSACVRCRLSAGRHQSKYEI